MTYSVIAAEPESGRIGAAIASRFLAVGSYCLYLDPVAGGVVTQSIANPLLGRRGLAGLAAGEAPDALLGRLLAEDPDAEHRQTHLMTPAGMGAVRTGTACGEWAGDLAAENVSFAGNLLAGPQVLAAMQSAWHHHAGDPLVERLLAALAAGETSGGDRRGVQAAAILVYAGEIYPEIDLRVDDCPGSSVAELHHLYHRHLAADVQAVRAAMPRQTLAAEGPHYPGIGDLSAVYAANPDDEPKPR